jgi:serralysin
MRAWRAVWAVFAFVFMIGTSTVTYADQFPSGVFPDGVHFPDGRYVLAFGAEDATYVGVIEYDATGAIVSTNRVFTFTDGSYTVSVRSPKVTITGADTYLVSAFAQRMTPGGEERGYIYSERQFAQPEPTVPPTPINEGAWSYGWGGMATDSSGSKLFSVSHRGDGAWDVYYYLLDKLTGQKLATGLLSSTTSNTQFNPKTLAIAGGNAFLSVWTDDSGSYEDQSGNAVLARIYEPGIGFWSDAFQVNLTTNGNQGDLDASGGRWELANYFIQNIGSDRVLIAYLSGDTATSNIYARIYQVSYDPAHESEPAFTPISDTEIPIGQSVSGNKKFLSALTLSNGSVLVSFVAEDAGANTLYSTILDLDGNTLQADAQIAANLGDDAAPSIVQLSSTMARAMWQEDLFAWPNEDASVYLVKGTLKTNDFNIGTIAADSVDGISSPLAPIDTYVANNIGSAAISSSVAATRSASIASPRKINPTNWNASRILLLAGDDTFSGSPEGEIIDAGTGRNVIDGGAGGNWISYSNIKAPIKVTLKDSNQATVYVGGVSQDKIKNISNVQGGLGTNTLVGDKTNNVFIGGPLADSFNGGLGSNTVSYLNSKSAVTASLKSPSTNRGDARGDKYISIQNIEGSEFSDTLIGNTSANVIIGRKGNDNIYGFGGNDVIIGGLGIDVLVGGTGSNIFQYRSLDEMPLGDSAPSTDSIVDFKVSSDKIDVSLIDANRLAGGTQAFTFVGESEFSGAAGQLRVFASAGDCYVQADVDGDQKADASIRLRGLTIPSQIMSSSFILN